MSKSKSKPSSKKSGGAKPKKPVARGTSKPVAKRPVSKSSTKKAGRPVSKSGGAKPVSTGKVGVKGGGVATAGTITATGEAATRLEALQSQFDGLQQSLMLTQVHDDMEQIGTGLAMLPAEIQELRTRGYVFRNYLDNKISVLSGEWDDIQDRVSNEVSRRSGELSREADEVAQKLSLASSGQASQITRAESAVSSLSSMVSAAVTAVGAMYQTLGSNVQQTSNEVAEIRWLLDEIESASFQLYPAESPVAACRARIIERNEEGAEGTLFLTDERLLFERSEEVATKKVLFITTEKETVRELYFEVPIGQIEEVKSSQKGFLGRKEILELVFTREADTDGALLRLLNVDNAEWVRLIGRVKSGDIAQERTEAKDEEVVEAAREAPTKCPTCNATLSVEVVRGMREITCEYCGSVIRL